MLESCPNHIVSRSVLNSRKGKFYKARLAVDWRVLSRAVEGDFKTIRLKQTGLWARNEFSC